MAPNDSFSFSLCSWLLLVKRPLKNLIHWGASPLGWRLDRHIWKTSLSLLKTHWSPKRKRCLTEFQVWFIMFAEWVRYYTKENTKKHDLEQDFLREGKHQKTHFWHEGKTLKTKFAQTITNPIFGGHSYENSYNLYCNFKITSPLDITPRTAWFQIGTFLPSLNWQIHFPSAAGCSKVQVLCSKVQAAMIWRSEHPWGYKPN